jgi:microcystin-dependent protein
VAVPTSDLPAAPQGASPLSGGDDYLRALVAALAPMLTPAGSGLFSARPASTGTTPGKLGRTWYATDQGVVYYDTGAGWVALNEQIGRVTYWAGVGDPPGGTHLEANHREISRSAYPLYWSIVGDRHGAGNGSTTVNLPDGGGRVHVGRDPNGSVLPALYAAGALNTAVGAKGGEERHTLTAAEFPHIVLGNVGVGQDNATVNVITPSGGAPLDINTAGGNPHNNMQPFVVLTPIVRVA